MKGLDSQLRPCKIDKLDRYDLYSRVEFMHSTYKLEGQGRMLLEAQFPETLPLSSNAAIQYMIERGYGLYLIATPISDVFNNTFGDNIGNLGLIIIGQTHQWFLLSNGDASLLKSGDILKQISGEDACGLAWTCKDKLYLEAPYSVAHGIVCLEGIGRMLTTKAVPETRCLSTDLTLQVLKECGIKLVRVLTEYKQRTYGGDILDFNPDMEWLCMTDDEIKRRLNDDDCIAITELLVSGNGYVYS